MLISRIVSPKLDVSASVFLEILSIPTSLILLRLQGVADFVSKHELFLLTMNKLMLTSGDYVV